MKRIEQASLNRRVINEIIRVLTGLFPPTYSVVVGMLNGKGYRTSRGNYWTAKRLLRMLQRNNVSGLWGLKKGVFKYW